MAHIRQSWPDSVIGFQVKVLNIVYAVCSLFARKRVALRSTSVSPLELFPRRSEAIRPTLPNNKRQKWVYTFVIRSRDEPCPIKEAWMPSKSLGRGIHTSSLGTSHTIFLLLSATRVTGASAVGCGVNRSLKPLEVFPRGASHAIPPTQEVRPTQYPLIPVFFRVQLMSQEELMELLGMTKIHSWRISRYPKLHTRNILSLHK